jgi:hypothetical protein
VWFSLQETQTKSCCTTTLHTIVLIFQFCPRITRCSTARCKSISSVVKRIKLIICELLKCSLCATIIWKSRHDFSVFRSANRNQVVHTLPTCDSREGFLRLLWPKVSATIICIIQSSLSIQQSGIRLGYSCTVTRSPGVYFPYWKGKWGQHLTSIHN